MFNVFYQAGILAGPLVGLAFMAVDFRGDRRRGGRGVRAADHRPALRAAPPRPRPGRGPSSIWQDWRAVLANRSSLLFAAAMTGSYVLSFQVYLALPLHAADLAPQHQALLIAALFVVSGVVAVAAQLRVTRWFSSRWGTSRSLVIGMTVVALSFTPLILLPDTRFGTPAGIAALLLSTAVLAIGSAARCSPSKWTPWWACPAADWSAPTTASTAPSSASASWPSNVATGALMQAASQHSLGVLVWTALTGIGLLCTAAPHTLARNGHLREAHLATANP